MAGRGRFLILGMATFATLMIGLISAAEAQLRLRTDNDWRGQFRTYLASRDYVDSLGVLIRDVENRIAPDCDPDLAGAKRQGLWVRKRILFDGGGTYPNAGQWQDRIAINRCGKRILHNFLVTALPDKSPAFRVLLPGNSRADARLQLDARSAVLAIASAQATSSTCGPSGFKIVSADFDRFLGDTANAELNDRIWREIWTTEACGRQILVEVKFVPKEKGYTFVVDLVRP